MIVLILLYDNIRIIYELAIYSKIILGEVLS